VADIHPKLTRILETLRYQGETQNILVCERYGSIQILGVSSFEGAETLEISLLLEVVFLMSFKPTDVITG
jgi:hypothetical protein